MTNHHSDPLIVARMIQDKVTLLEKGRAELEKRAKRKAESIANYEKNIAIVTMGLKNGQTFELEGEAIENPPATLIDKIAKGVCYQEKLDAELSDAQYRNAIVGLTTIQAELNGLQSINRHLSEL